MVTVSINRVNMAVRTGRRAVERSPQLSEGIPSLGRLPSKFFSGKRGLGGGGALSHGPFPQKLVGGVLPPTKGVFCDLGNERSLVSLLQREVRVGEAG